MNDDRRQSDTVEAWFASHPRTFAENRYVYPVVSRRAGGISIGVNLNLDKVCNFDCVYCQVNRSEPGDKEFVELGRLGWELDAMVSWSSRARSPTTRVLAHAPAACGGSTTSP